MKTAKQIFIEAGFNPEVIGNSRIKAFAAKWRKKYRDNGILALEDTRKNCSGRPRKTEFTPEQQIKKLQSKIALLEQENQLLKKSEWSERRLEEPESPSETFARILAMRTDGSYKGRIIDACELLGVSRSGYYNYVKNADNRRLRETEDQEW